METVFSLSALLVVPFWLAMIVATRWGVTRRVIGSPLVVLAPALLYGVLVLPRVGELLPTLSSPTLVGVAELLSTPAGATIAWVHFLAFDLFVGRWEYLDSRERDLSPWLMAPVLLLTFMFGPLGFAVYLLVRAVVGRRAPHRAGGRGDPQVGRGLASP